MLNLLVGIAYVIPTTFGLAFMLWALWNFSLYGRRRHGHRR
jgi:hypothetical protein